MITPIVKEAIPQNGVANIKVMAADMRNTELVIIQMSSSFCGFAEHGGRCWRVIFGKVPSVLSKANQGNADQGYWNLWIIKHRNCSQLNQEHGPTHVLIWANTPRTYCAISWSVGQVETDTRTTTIKTPRVKVATVSRVNSGLQSTVYRWLRGSEGQKKSYWT